MERHERMNEATREANAELASDVALRATTEAALKMMVANQVGRVVVALQLQICMFPLNKCSILAGDRQRKMLPL